MESDDEELIKSASEKASTLHNMLNEKNINYDSFFAFLLSTTNYERQIIAEEYKSKFTKTIFDDINTQISNKDVKYIIAFNDGVYENFKFINNIEKDKNDIYKMISDYFIEHLKDEKPISSIISDLFENKLINLKIDANNKNNIRNVVANNLSCTIIEFFS